MNSDIQFVFKNSLLCIVIGYIANKIISFTPIFNFNQAVLSYHYSIEKLFLIFGILSITILVVLVFIKKKSIDYVGMSFLLGTSVKMAISYMIALPIVSSLNNNTVEKINFYTVFIYFLIIETLLTIKLLNQKP